MSENSWIPDDVDKSQTIGGVDSGGAFINPGTRRRHNQLEKSSHPVVRGLGKFCYETEPHPDPGYLTFGGLLIGLRLAQRYPDVATEVLNTIESEGMTPPFTTEPDNPLDGMVDAIVNFDEDD